MPDVPWIEWYQSLAKPSWTPAPRTIGLIWQILYPVIIATFGFVFVQAARGRLTRVVALPFATSAVAQTAAAPVPYFVWVSIATVLQLSITWMNRALG